MANFTLATPRPYLDGIKDISGSTIPVTPEAIPQNCPLYMFMGKKGKTTTQFMTGGMAALHYGSETFQETSKFFSHQTNMAMATAGQGNLIACRRMVADDAEAPVLVAAIEVVENENPVYEVMPNGRYKVDINGDRVDTGATQLGYLVRFVYVEGVDMYNWNKQIVMDGTWTGNTGQTSKIYPLFAVKGDIGEHGNNVGFRISQEHADTAQPSSVYTQKENEAIVYRFSWLERAKLGATPVITKTLLASDVVDFSFKEGVVNDKTNQTFDYRAIKSAYEDVTPGFVPRYGPVDDVHFYTAFIKEVQELLFAAESAAAGNNVVSADEINLFGELDYMGRAYKTIQNGPVVANSLSADGVTVNYLMGGDDGTVSEAELDSLVRAFLESDWDNPDEPLNSWAKYPFSGFHDSGFELDTKFAMLDTMAKRDDITIDVCTFIASQPAHDMATELNIGLALQARGLLSPESIVHGTQSCRFNIWGSEGQDANSIFKRRCTSFLDVAEKYAAFAGAGSGFLKIEDDYTHRDNNAVSRVIHLTHTYKAPTVQDLYWNAGINYPQLRTTSEVFWSAYQSGYEDDTSVLNSTLYVKIVTYLKRLARYHWSINTGSTGMSEEEFIERSDEDWEELTAGKFAGKMVVTGKTVITPDDSQRGFSWALDINAAADPMRTVGQYNLTVARLSA